MCPVAYTESFRGEGTKFRHNRVTSQINFMESAEGTIILGWSGGISRKNFAELHLKILLLKLLGFALHF